MIRVSDVNLTFETNDGPVDALKNVSMEAVSYTHLTLPTSDLV